MVTGANWALRERIAIDSPVIERLHHAQFIETTPDSDKTAITHAQTVGYDLCQSPPQ